MTSSTDWNCSNSVHSHFSSLIHNYLDYYKENDYTKYTMGMRGHDPIILTWQYTSIPKPTKAMLEIIKHQVYTFDIIDSFLVEGIKVKKN